LNAQASGHNLAATLDSTGKLSNLLDQRLRVLDAGTVASGGVIGGTVTSSLTFSTAAAPVLDASAQAVRSNLVSQYNNILSQITTTAQDASFKRHQPAQRRPAQADVQRDRQVDVEHHRRHLNAAGLGLRTSSAAPTSSTTPPPTGW